MSAGRITLWRNMLLSHPSFFGESEISQLPSQILEDPKVIQREIDAHDHICSLTTPFIANLDEATVNLPSRNGSSEQSSHNFVRLLRPPTSALKTVSRTSYGWEERHSAYELSVKVIFGPSRLLGGGQCGHCPTEATQRLMERLTAAKLESSPLLSSTGKNGGRNSLFESISTALFGSSSYHSALRQLAVEEMRDNSEEYALFLGRDFEAYLANMSKNGVYGDELVLHALADRLGVPITVVSGDDSSVWCVRFPPRKTTSKREVLLAVVPNGRFSVIRRLSTISSIRMSIRGTFGTQPIAHKKGEIPLNLQASHL